MACIYTRINHGGISVCVVHASREQLEIECGIALPPSESASHRQCSMFYTECEAHGINSRGKLNKMAVYIDIYLCACRLAAIVPLTRSRNAKCKPRLLYPVCVTQSKRKSKQSSYRNLPYILSHIQSMTCVCVR